LANVIIDPVCSIWTLYDASTHHLITSRLSTLNLYFICFVPLRFFNTWFNFPQPSSSCFHPYSQMQDGSLHVPLFR
jgi:hypothetical protein